MPPNANADSSKARLNMKLLFDANLSHKLTLALADVFPGSSHVRTIGLKDQSDRNIWDYAQAHGLVIVTLDQDFYDMSCYYGPPPKVIWLRLGNQPTRVYEKVLREQMELIRRFENDPDAGCLELI